MAIATITCKVSDTGKLPEVQREYLKRVLLGESGNEVTITVSEPARSISQNAFLHGPVLGTIQRAMYKAGVSVSVEALKIHLKRKYLPSGVEMVFGHEVVTDGKSSKLSRKRFSEWVDQILSDDDVVQYLAVSGEYVPSVEQYEYRNKVKVTG